MLLLVRGCSGDRNLSLKLFHRDISSREPNSCQINETYLLYNVSVLDGFHFAWRMAKKKKNWINFPFLSYHVTDFKHFCRKKIVNELIQTSQSVKRARPAINIVIYSYQRLYCGHTVLTELTRKRKYLFPVLSWLLKSLDEKSIKKQIVKKETSWTFFK